MKLYLDDERECPPGWVYVSTAKAAIKLLATGMVKELSLDHDLGEPEEVNGTGYDVLLWLEEQVFVNDRRDLIPDVIKIHSANPVGQKKMLTVVQKLIEMKGH